MVERTVGGAVGRIGPAGRVRAAVGVLTRLPVGAVVDEPGAVAFALVGAALGLVAALPLLLFGLAGEPVLGAIAAVATLTGISGGLHIDGLADTADALLAPDRAAAERARKDPAVGPGGTAAIVIVLGSQVAALASVTVSSGAPVAAAILVVGGAASRWVAVAAVVLLRRWVGPDGLGAWFSARVSGADAGIGAGGVVLVAFLAAGVAGWAIVPAALIGIGIGIGGTALVARARGGLDGDGLGAAVEIALTATLVGLALVAR
jgi:adenosylcobinamide-GDP ribazoletransferase